MTKKYKYKLRPGYKTNDLLIEFDVVEKPDLLIHVIIELLSDAGFEIPDIPDVIGNGELWIEVTSKQGSAFINIDNWDIIFILANNSQRTILYIDAILLGSGHFLKLDTDPADYITPQKI